MLYDAIIIGGGHNGLTCASLLAKRNKKVIVCEARSELGGLCANESISNSSIPRIAHITSGLHPNVRSSLGISNPKTNKQLRSICLSETGEHLKLSNSIQDNWNEIKKHSSKDAENYLKLEKKLSLFSKTLGSFMHSSPPRIMQKNFSDNFKLFKLGLNVRLMGKKNFNEFARMIGLNIADELEDNFTNPLLQGLIAHDAVIGSNLGPRSPGTVINLLYRMAIQDNSLFGGIQSIKAGEISITKVLEKKAIDNGVEIMTSSAVKRCLVEKDCIKGVELENGETIQSDTVISNADPKSTYFCLLGSEYLDTDFIRRVKHYRSKGRVAKLNLLLNKLPKFKNLDSSDLNARLVFAPSIDYIEENFNLSKFENLSSEPILEICFPTLNNSKSSKNGQHVMSILVQYSAYNLRGGWNNKKDEYIKSIISLLKKFAPDIDSCIDYKDFLSPNDIEDQYNVTGGHWHHGEIQIDQLFMLRPIPGYAQYKTPMKGLYLCGAGTHPGGGINGLPGKNAAEVVMKNF